MKNNEDQFFGKHQKERWFTFVLSLLIKIGVPNLVIDRFSEAPVLVVGILVSSRFACPSFQAESCSILLFVRLPISSLFKR